MPEGTNKVIAPECFSCGATDKPVASHENSAWRCQDCWEKLLFSEPPNTGAVAYGMLATWLRDEANDRLDGVIELRTCASAIERLQAVVALVNAIADYGRPTMNVSEHIDKMCKWFDEAREFQKKGLLVSEDKFVEGIKATRIGYAQAWADGTGEKLNELEFTTDYVTSELKRMCGVLDRLCEVTDSASYTIALDRAKNGWDKVRGRNEHS